MATRKPSAKPLEEYLTPRQVAEMFDVDRRTLARWVTMGTFPKPLKLTTQTLRFRKADVDRVVAERGLTEKAAG
jgi:predicted DNA-binding transcriptional regulator AlpA